jgi:hypothetical protein
MSVNTYVYVCVCVCVCVCACMRVCVCVCAVRDHRNSLGAHDGLPLGVQEVLLQTQHLEVPEQTSILCNAM